MKTTLINNRLNIVILRFAKTTLNKYTQYCAFWESRLWRKKFTNQHNVVIWMDLGLGKIIQSPG